MLDPTTELTWEHRAKEMQKVARLHIARNDELRAENAALRERLRFHDEFLSTLRGACLKAQGIEKDKPLGKRAVADRGLIVIFDKEGSDGSNTRYDQQYPS